jgi:serine/threonine-protein kinase
VVVFVVLSVADAVATRAGIRPKPMLALQLFTMTGNAILIGMLARMFSPFLIAPGVAAATTIAMLGSPLFRRERMIGPLVALMITAVLVPWLLELVGVLAPTMSFDAGRMTIHDIKVEISAFPVQAGLATFTVALVFVAALVSRALSRGDEDAQRRLHLQAWQLRQLVPEPASQR